MEQEEPFLGSFPFADFLAFASHYSSWGDTPSEYEAIDLI